MRAIGKLEKPTDSKVRLVVAKGGIMKMNPEIKKEWVAALRSGEYKQGTRYLHRTYSDGDVFCCLGVLCELAVKAGQVSSRPVGLAFQYGSQEEPADGESRASLSVLPSAVVKWTGLKEGNPHVKFKLHGTMDEHSLAWLNDGGATFEEIAQAIEENL